MKRILDNLIVLAILSLAFYSCDGKKSPGAVSGETYFSSGPEHGHLVIAGGNLTDSSVFNRFMELAGGPEAPIVIVSTARTDEDLAEADFYANQRKRFKGYGFRNLTFLHTRNRDTANDIGFVNSINKANGVWFLGGRQWRLVDAYSGSETLIAFNDLLNRGGVIGGSSAGASIQADYLVRGDTKTNTVMMGDHEQGFGFLSNVQSISIY